MKLIVLRYIKYERKRNGVRIRAVIEAIQADKEVDKILVKRDLQGDYPKSYLRY